MKLLLDQNLPSRILRDVGRSFPESVHVKDTSLAQASDLEVWEYALRQRCAIVTKDLDFRDIVGLRGFPPKVVLIRWGNISNDALVSKLIASFVVIQAFLDDNENGLLELF